MRRLSIPLFGLLAAAMLALTPVPAAAQNDPIGGFFRMLFGAPPQRAAPPPAAVEPPRKVRPPEPKIVEIPKNSDAQVIAVIGDVQAQGLAFGLQMAFADEPSLVVVAKARASAGLIRDGDADWTQAATKIIADTKADFVVTMIGVNDWQPFPVPGAKPFDMATDDWKRLYGERLDRYVAVLKASGKPFWWVGLPPTADPDLKPTARANYAAFLSGLNDLARPRVQAAGGTFVDIWNAFTDEEGHYTANGPDVDGQVKRLRASDGILFTRAGQRKLAFFVEEGIRKVMRGDTPTTAPAVPEETVVAPKPEEAIVAGPPPLPPAPWSLIGPVLPLGDAAPDAPVTLAGGPDRKPRAELPGGFPVAASPGWRRLVEGLPIDGPPGRVDDIVRRTP
ncbi:DUF459 domain-containing protein [Siculibacillus lacustris]|uniref:DUF459 domain-containing protein n=1 Tax=Siculibacillus lacustris TaxID=1549641 RepID=A0A4V2KUB5_9HYPH|nr:DUF459 domain-containing protein [Siculibacillus lacustris]TBW40748.1 DUF459 domain-containing protein [Siculibacillus lacustris]